VQRIILDGVAWQTGDDFYDALLDALGAPVWHGHNLDAINDSFTNGNINRVNPPFAISIIGCDQMGPEARVMVTRFCDHIGGLHAEGHQMWSECS
jgi:RNAse (barnase) inhibitor barstar